MPWKPLPDTLSPESLRFVTRLRELKDHAGVSLAVLAKQTAYSKSSWERCLNGSALPPRQAVEAMCRFIEQPAAPVLALWELADLTWGTRPGGTPTGPAPAAEPAPRRPYTPRRGHPEQPAPSHRLPAQRTEDTGRRPEPRDGTTRRRYALRTVAVTAALVAAVTLPLTWWLAGTLGRPATRHFPAPDLATARPLCAGRACQGEEAKATWCSGTADTVARKRTAEGAMFEVLYARACGAAWGRMWFSRHGDRLVISLAGDRFSVQDTDPVTTGSYHSTPMLATDTPRRITACYLPEKGPRVCIPHP
ncbi:helix-turn-helix domain-containing protein [Streptomyces cinerochromogenes]|uniref:helix-turn-helix domain-containing protein n=1 Tax=Streptomyces cinerochromogenes TaxID=66422 RepID=UPI0033AD176E